MKIKVLLLGLVFATMRMQAQTSYLINMLPKKWVFLKNMLKVEQGLY